MGTSKSSEGPGRDVPMVPPWVPEAETASSTDIDMADVESREEDVTETPSSESVPIPLAPSTRFVGARRALGKYAQSGDRNKMRCGLGHYIRKGSGGTSTAARRFGGTARTAETLGVVLMGLATGQVASSRDLLDPDLLAGQTADQIMCAITEAVRPVDGTLDAEAERASICDALSELLTRFPDANLLDLDDEQRNYAIKQFTAINVFRWFELDLGKTVHNKAPNASKALKRLGEVRDYIRQSVDKSFRKLRAAGHTLKGGQIRQLVRAALEETFKVFESYVT